MLQYVLVTVKATRLCYILYYDDNEVNVLLITTRSNQFLHLKGVDSPDVCRLVIVDKGFHDICHHSRLLIILTYTIFRFYGLGLLLKKIYVD